MPKSADRPDGARDGTDPRIPEEVLGYIAAIPTRYQPLFDRLQELILKAHPDATVSLSYNMPVYKVGKRRVFLGAWKHGISIYGWQQDDDGGFAARHPSLKTSTGTIRLRPDDAAAISDTEFLGLLRPAL
jgi:uncharacterized protein DUF1801